MTLGTQFARWARASARAAGHSITTLLAFAVIVVWAVTGPFWHFSDSWQLVINTLTSIITFLMVFLIQHSQNSDTAAIHLKLDELIRCSRDAHNVVLDLEKLSQEELDKILERYHELAEHSRRELREGLREAGTADLIAEEAAEEGV